MLEEIVKAVKLAPNINLAVIKHRQLKEGRKGCRNCTIQHALRQSQCCVQCFTRGHAKSVKTEHYKTMLYIEVQT